MNVDINYYNNRLDESWARPQIAGKYWSARCITLHNPVRISAQHVFRVEYYYIVLKNLNAYKNIYTWI